MPHAFLLELTPSQGHPRPEYLSQYAHGLFFHLLRAIDPELAKIIHDKKRKPFTLSARQLREIVLLRITTLDDELFKPLLKVILQESLAGLSLGQDSYRVARVLATPEGHPDAGFISWGELYSAPPLRRLELRFLTPTVFTTSRSDGKRHYTPLPIPRLILQSLLSSFQHYSPKPYDETHLAGLALVFEEQLEVHRCEIRTQRYQAGKTVLTGFTGRITLHYPEHTAQVMQAVGRLGVLAFYSGVGAKTPYGMGQVRVVKESAW
jgi:CRISPR-associated endoribonuclease Cas6